MPLTHISWGVEEQQLKYLLCKYTSSMALRGKDEVSKIRQAWKQTSAVMGTSWRGGGAGKR